MMRSAFSIRSIFTAFIFSIMLLLAPGAQAQTEPTVLVQLTSVQKGNLPQTVTAYGRIQAGPSGSQTIMAPLSAIVADVAVEPGQTVAQNAPLLSLAPSPPTAASYTEAESALRVADDLVSHTRQMVAQHLATVQQLADAEKAKSDASATLDALKAQGADGTKILRASFPAIVTAVSVSPGSVVVQGSPMVQLARPQGLLLQVGLVPNEAAAVAPGNKVTVTPLGGGAALQGTVLLRGSVVQSTDGLVPVDITVPPGHLFVDEMAKASITTGQVTGYVVPHEAILVNDQGQTYVVQSVHMTAKTVPVQVLGFQGAKDVIAGALDPALPLVLGGNYQLDDGMKMRVAAVAGKARP